MREARRAPLSAGQVGDEIATESPPEPFTRMLLCDQRHVHVELVSDDGEDEEAEGEGDDLQERLCRLVGVRHLLAVRSEAISSGAMPSASAPSKLSSILMPLGSRKKS